MKYFILVTLLSLNLSAQELKTDGNIQTILNPPKLGEVFVPPGFDDLDEAEVTFVNHSASSCFIKTYSLAPAVDEVNKVIRISNMSLVLKSDFCKSRSVATPTTLRVGELKAGTYKIEFKTAEGEYQSYGDINISKSKSEEKDDYEYADLNVNELTVKVDREAKEIHLNLPGSFPHGCYYFKEVKVIQDRSPNVIEVLPIVDMRNADGCSMAIVEYNEKVVIPYNVTDTTKKLIHIRAAGGVAINRVVTLEP